ncbi:MAG: hypothetical protein PSX81_12155 [bacterium]|nr:hypothetical protein [bacterium]
MKLKILFGICLIGAMGCTKKDNGPRLINDTSPNSLNFGLIGINQNNLYLNKVNDVTAYDFGGNQIKILNTYNRLKYNSMCVKDSLLVLSNSEMILYRLTYNNTLIEITNPNYLYQSYTTNELLLKDTVLFLLNQRFSSNTRTYYSSQAESRLLNIYNYNALGNKILTLEKTSHLNLQASSFALFQDSVVFYMNSKINKFNINNPKPLNTSFDFLFNPENALTTTICIGDRIYTSNSRTIFGFSYANNKLTAKGELK